MKNKILFLFFIITIRHESIAQTPQLIPFTKDSLWGYCDQNLKVVIPVKYSKAYPFENGYGIVERNKKYALVDKTGKEYLPFVYDGIVPLDNGLFYVRNNCKHGFIDISGKEVIPVTNTMAKYQNKHMVCSNSKNEILFYNQKGVFLTKIKIDDSWFNPLDFYGRPPFTNFFPVTINKKMGLVRYDGSFLVQPDYDQINDPYRWIVVQRNQKYGIFNLEGKLILKTEFENVESFQRPDENRFEVKLNGKWGIVDSSGKTILPFIYDNILKRYLEFNNSIFIVNKEGKGGIVDLNGNLLTTLEYDFSKCDGNSFQIDGPFNFNNYLRVRLCNKRGILDSKYKQILPIIYDEIEGFVDGYSLVKRNGKCGYINSAGKEVIPCKYESLGIIRNNLVEVYSEKKLIGYVGIDGKEYFN